MLMAYRVVERAPPKENEKHNNVVVTSLPVSLLSVHHFFCAIKAKTENVKTYSMAFGFNCLQGVFPIE